MTLLITLASVAGYFAIGGWTARRAVVVLSRTQPRMYQTEQAWHSDNTAAAVLCGVFWPILAAFMLLRDFVARPISRWLWRPVVEAEERMERLEVDREAWRVKRRDATTDEERRMASDVIESLDDIIRRSR